VDLISWWTCIHSK